MDCRAAQPETRAFAGWSWNRRQPCWGRCWRGPWPTASRSASDPFRLLLGRPDGASVLVLAAPVLRKVGASPVGFVTFSSY